VDDVVQWLIFGVPIGCVYALVATGLVLTYKTSGVFNLAFSAQAFASGAVFYQMAARDEHPLWLSFVVAVLIVGPLIGLILDRCLFRYMRTASWQVKLVSALGLLLAMPEIVRAFFGYENGDAPPSVAVMLGMKQNGGGWGFWKTLGYNPSLGIFNLGDYYISADRMVTVVVTLITVVGLVILFRYTALGLQMRAVVESPRMVELAGVDSERVSLVAWMLSSLLAGLAGVLLAPLYFTLDPNIYTLLIIAAIAAAAVGRFTSIPMVFVGGLLIGIGERALPDIVGTTSEFAADLRPSFPFLVLFLLLVFWPRLREQREVTDPLAGVDPPPPAMAHEYKDEALQRLSRIAFPVFMVGFVVAMLTLVSPAWVSRLTGAFVLAVIFLSITIFTGLGGQISLMQATFAAAGGFALANASEELGIPVLLGMVLGGIVAAAAGAVFVLFIDGLPTLIGRLRGRPVPRLSGLYLSLATLAAALMAEHVIFAREEVSHGQFGVSVHRPDFAQSDRAWFLVVFGVFAVAGLLVILVRKGTTGRYFGALRGSETAAASIGINATLLRIMLFALAAGVAGVGGGLLAMDAGTINPISSYPAIFGVLWVVLVVTLGSRTVDGAVNAALGLIVSQWLLDALGFPVQLAIIGFGLGAITYARHPEGIVEFQTRKSILAQRRQRALRERATELEGEGKLPPQYRPVWHIALPVIAGPALYFLYVLIRSAIQGHWVAVHSTTLLCFIVPSLVVALVWIALTDARLRRIGGYANGPLVLLAGAVGGALVGWFFDANDWLARGSLTDCLLVGIPAGYAAVAFFLLPMHVNRIARARGWLSTPISWREGRAPLGFLLFGAFLFFRTSVTDTSTSGLFFDKGFPPAGWPVFFVAAITIIVWVQWLAAVQGACNEIAIGGEGFEPPPETRVVEPARDLAPASSPAGGGA
jgi:branched-chain amino acid transport system permease protein